MVGGGGRGVLAVLPRAQLIWFLFFSVCVFFVSVMIECLVCCSALSLLLWLSLYLSLFSIVSVCVCVLAPASLPCVKRIKYFEAG